MERSAVIVVHVAFPTIRDNVCDTIWLYFYRLLSVPNYETASYQLDVLQRCTTRAQTRIQAEDAAFLRFLFTFFS